jgi:hypothetical protein
MNIPDTDLPPLPEWITHDDFDGLVQSQIRAAFREAQRQAYAKGIADFLKMHEGKAVAWIAKRATGESCAFEANDPDLELARTDATAVFTPTFLAPQPQEVEAAVMAEFDNAVEAAKLLGRTQARAERGDYTEQDSRFERAMYESIAKHRAAIRARTTSPETSK